MQNLINYQNFLSTQDPRFYIFFLFITVWSIAWKGFALWKAGRNNSPIWFIILLLVNTLGLLEIIYLFVIKNNEVKSEAPSPVPAPVASDSAKSYVETKKAEEINHEEIKTEESASTSSTSSDTSANNSVPKEEIKQEINQ